MSDISTTLAATASAAAAAGIKLLIYFFPMDQAVSEGFRQTDA